LSQALDVNLIRKLLPHRYPFLLVDRVIEMQRRKRIVAIKCVTVNEPFFQGHFPEVPVMPGVLIVEALAQAAGALIVNDIEDRDDKLMMFTGIDGCRFRRPVVPGDVLRLEVDVLQLRARAARLKAVALVDGEVAAEATLMSVLTDREHLT
jgi:3-hydroxyacyl-[acyl-carrier-protein] dehydratase